MKIRSWHIAGSVAAIAVVALVTYAVWPDKDDENEARQLAANAERGNARSLVDVTVLREGVFIVQSEATGRLIPWRRSQISAEASGVLLRRNVEEGDFVTAGSVVLKLDDRDERIALEEARAEHLTRRVEYAVQLSQAGERETSRDTTRLSQLREAYAQALAGFDAGHLAAAEVSGARRLFEAEMLLTGAEGDAVRVATTGLAAAEQAVERATLNLERTRIRAPFPGRIADLEVEVGQRISVGQSLFSLLDDSRMKVEVDVLEANMGGLARGAGSTIRVPSLADTTLSGSVFSINPAIDPARGTGRITVAVNNPGRLLISGMYAHVGLEADVLKSRLVLPLDAILIRQNRNLVFRVEEGKAKWVYVETGHRSAGMVEILDGLASGDTIAVGGHFALAHDAPVETRLADQR